MPKAEPALRRAVRIRESGNTRRNLFEVAGAALLGLPDPTKAGADALTLDWAFGARGDAALSALAAEYGRNDEATDAACRELGVAEKAARARRDRACPKVAEINRTLDLLHENACRLAKEIAIAEAESFFGIVMKLVVWRLEAVKAGAGFDQMHDAFAFSAYLDALRLTGMTEAAHPKDRRTLHILRTRNWTDPAESD